MVEVAYAYPNSYESMSEISPFSLTPLLSKLHYLTRIRLFAAKFPRTVKRTHPLDLYPHKPAISVQRN